MKKAVWAGLIGILALTGVARADDFPSHPITIIVPFAAGGPRTRWRGCLPSGCG